MPKAEITNDSNFMETHLQPYSIRDHTLIQCSPKSSSSSWPSLLSPRRSPQLLASRRERLSLTQTLATSTRETRREDAPVTLDMSVSWSPMSPRTSRYVGKNILQTTLLQNPLLQSACLIWSEISNHNASSGLRRWAESRQGGQGRRYGQMRLIQNWQERQMPRRHWIC